MEILRTENLTFYYPEKSLPALENVSVSINKGEFITVLGETGCGKSTFLKMLKNEITPQGVKSGSVFINCKNQKDLTKIESASTVGYVMQHPEMQIVTDKVYHELSFGLENLGVSSDEISLKIAEMASYFGIEDLFEKEVNVLSGGQKQMMNLASVLVMNPKILLLDEPMSQLDPIAASEFISMLKKINRDMGITVIIIEHRLEELLPLSDKILVFDNGKIKFFDSPHNVINEIEKFSELISFFPIPSRLYKLLDESEKCPLTVRDGRKFLEAKYNPSSEEIFLNNETEHKASRSAIEFKNVFFKYNREDEDILNNLNFKVYENEVFCLLGGNGSGKSTLLSVTSGFLKAYSGKIKIFDKQLKEYKNNSLFDGYMTLLPQDVQTLFSSDTVFDELNNDPYFIFDVEKFKEYHPYDLSAGEQQLLAFAKILSRDSKIILLDEPTKGIDPITKNKIIDIINVLKKNGKTILIVTHDIEFASECADRCALLFRGKISSVNFCRKFFRSNRFYTTSVCRMCSEHYPSAVTLKDLLFLCRKNKKEIIK